MREDQVVEATGDIRDELPAEYAYLVPEPMRVVCGPMVAAGRAVGVIVADRSLDAPPLDGAERHLLWTLGKAAALASVARNVATQAETARQLRQRIDLAREVHEGVIQRLFGISMVLDGSGDLPEEVRARAASEIQAALGELREAIAAPARAQVARDHDDVCGRAQARGRRQPRSQHQLCVRCGGQRARASSSHWRRACSDRGDAQHSQARAADPGLRSARPSGDGTFVLEVINDGVASSRRHQPGMGLRLAAFEALQSGGIVEFGPRGEDSWQVRLVVPHDG